MSDIPTHGRRMMTAASVTKACGRPTTNSGFYTTPATSRNAPPPGNGSADDCQHSPSHVPSHLPDLDKPSPSPLTDKPTNGTDSGYVSGAPTPDKDKGTLAQKLFKRTPKKLSIFDQDIPDPVKNRFHDLYVLFNEPLYRYLRKHGVTLTAISIKLKYAGESEATANPWIIVQCDERASKRVRRFFNQQQIKAQYQPRDTRFPDVNFGLLVHGTPPKQMATDSEHYIYGDMWNGAPTLCGKPIKICTSGETRLATLGGIIKVVSQEGLQLYGMTAGHIITRETFAQDVMDKHDHTYGKWSTEDRFSAVNNTSMMAAPEDGRTNKASMTDDQSRDGENDHDEGSEQGDEEDEYELDLGAVDDQQEKSSIDPAALSQRLRRSDLLQTHWPKLGHLSSVSRQPASKHDLDWALIKLEDPSLYRPNLLVFPESTYEFGVSARLIEGPRRLTRATRSRDVLLLSGMAGLKRGKLATSFGYIMIGPVKQFNEVYNVSMSDGSVIDAGDCGSWVVDSVTHEVYGHVIASDAFGDAYVIPLDNTFRDIRQQLAADHVCLPTEREVLEWIQQRNNTLTSTYPSIMNSCVDSTLPNLQFRLEQETIPRALKSEDFDEQPMLTAAGFMKSYGFMDGHRAPISSRLDGDSGGRPADHLMSTAAPDIFCAGDMGLVGASPDSGYSSRRSSPLGHSQASGAISSTVSATEGTYCRNSRLAEGSSTHMQSSTVLSPSSAEAIYSQK